MGNTFLLKDWCQGAGTQGLSPQLLCSEDDRGLTGLGEEHLNKFEAGQRCKMNAFSRIPDKIRDNKLPKHKL